MTTANTDWIEKYVVLRAPRARVWRALANAEEFGKWFRVELSGAFEPGAQMRGHVTYPGYEHLTFEITVDRVEPERLLSWRWHPAPVEAGVDYSTEPTTLVVFELEEVPEGTRLTVVESGFDRIPLPRRTEAYRMNEGGWAEQMKNIESHLKASKHP